MMLRAGLVVALLCLGVMTSCSSPDISPSAPPVFPQGTFKIGKSYQIDGRWYHPRHDPDYDRRGVASWYGPNFHGKPTANGERFDRHRVSAAHPTLPLPSLVEVTNLDNGRRMVVRVNDRGPFADDRLIDLSEAAARELGFHEQGLANVRVRFVAIADGHEPPAVSASGSARMREPPPARPVPVVLAERACPVDAHFVQVAAVRDGGRAEALRAQLSAMGTVQKTRLREDEGALIRLRLGPVADRRAAFDLVAELRRRGYGDAFVASC